MKKHILVSVGIVIGMATLGVASADSNTPVECSTSAVFAQNSCNQCFAESLEVGTSLTDLKDTWINTGTLDQVVFKEEQKYPSLIVLDSATNFSTNPADPASFWEYGPKVVWTDSISKPGKKEFILTPEMKQEILFSSKIGSQYKLESTSKAGGDPLAVIKYPIVYHTLDDAGKEGPLSEHTECVLYSLRASAAATPVVVAPPVATPVVTPVKPTTKPHTGNEIFLAAALLSLLGAGALTVNRLRKQYSK